MNPYRKKILNPVSQNPASPLQDDEKGDKGVASDTDPGEKDNNLEDPELDQSTSQRNQSVQNRSQILRDKKKEGNL